MEMNRGGADEGLGVAPARARVALRRQRTVAVSRFRSGSAIRDGEGPR
ncbi:hypothetical protein ACIP46_29805 [Streptomyces lavendulae]|nr:hypothetical protein [Streptomyces lavendulae]GLW00379.1 hypothetical protein Slala05_40100 [Streptomyces lavendulae subsp. lavendulae]